MSYYNYSILRSSGKYLEVHYFNEILDGPCAIFITLVCRLEVCKKRIRIGEVEENNEHCCNAWKEFQFDGKCLALIEQKLGVEKLGVGDVVLTKKKKV